MIDDSEVIELIGGSEMVGKSVSLLGMKTTEDKEMEATYRGCEDEDNEEGEEEKEKGGVSVSEKNGILGIVLEVVEGGGWKGKYDELEEVVGRLEEEGKKRRTESNGAKGQHGWKEMGRLAHEVGWAIEERKLRDGRGGDGEMITLQGMKKNLEEEKKRADEEKRMKEEEMQKVAENGK